jgi:hypothetical protein
MCGGCRARAYGVSGDFMAEDPWCAHEPGEERVPAIEPPNEVYGREVAFELTWTPEALERVGFVPGFVRGKVVASTESWAHEHGYAVVTPEVMHRAREERLGGRVAGVPAFVQRLIAAAERDD